jgi:energy-converting hydrogenase Eha subunit B
MTVRKLSPTGDMIFGNSMLDFISNTPATVAQVVKTSLLLWLGEWYLDNTLGMPWIEGVLGKHSEDTADATVQDYVSNVQGVTDIANYVSSADESRRLYTATATLDTLYGPTPVQLANQSNF